MITGNANLDNPIQVVILDVLKLKDNHDYVEELKNDLMHKNDDYLERFWTLLGVILFGYQRQQRLLKSQLGSTLLCKKNTICDAE